MGSNQTLLALDVGSRRVGVAVATLAARLPSPFMTLEYKEDIFDQIATLTEQCLAQAVIVGLPRGLEGQETAQTQFTLSFVNKLVSYLHIPVHTQDEALTSREAEEELKQRGVNYSKADIDSLAATLILEDFLRDNPEMYS